MQTGDSPQYDIDVVDEAIVNAVAHRDYAIAGSKIRLFLFADRLELYSPGKLPNTITIDDMAYRTFTRNQLLVNFLSRIRSKRTGQVFLESRGEGVRKILEDGEAHSGRRPKYELFATETAIDVVGQVTFRSLDIGLLLAFGVGAAVPFLGFYVQGSNAEVHTPARSPISSASYF